MWLGLLSGEQDEGTPRPPFGKLTRLSVDGYGAKRAGSFSSKFQGDHTPGKITRLSLDGYGAKRAGSFAGRGDQNIGTAAGTSTASAVGAWVFQGVGTSAGTSTVTAINASIFQAVATSAGTSTVTAIGAASDHPVGKITRLALDGYGAKRAGSFANKSGAVGIGTSAGVGAAVATALSTWQSAGFADTPQGVRLDGANDLLNRGTDLTGIVDGRQGTFAAWVSLKTGGVRQEIVANGGNFVIERTAANKIKVRLFNAGGTASFSFETVGTYATTGPTHILAAWDTNFGAGLKVAHLYINDVSDITVTADADAAFDIDYTDGTFAVGAFPSGSNKLDADLADVRLKTAYTDFSVTANRRQHISVTGKYVPLGADGWVVLLRGPANVFATNRGTGGNFTVTGALTDAEINPPSDGPAGIALGISATTSSGAASAAGVGTATAISDTSVGVGVSVGAGVAAAVGQSTADMVASAAGTSTADATGIAFQSGDGTAAGTSAVAGVAVADFQAVATASGSGAATGVILGDGAMDGLSFGNGVASAVAVGGVLGVGIANGFASVIGEMRGAESAPGSASGTAEVLGAGAVIVPGVGFAFGISPTVAGGAAAGWIPVSEDDDIWEEVEPDSDTWTPVTPTTTPWTET